MMDTLEQYVGARDRMTGRETQGRVSRRVHGRIHSAREHDLSRPPVYSGKFILLKNALQRGLPWSLSNSGDTLMRYRSESFCS
jgi:hypothetical protein